MRQELSTDRIMDILWINQRNVARECGGIESITLTLASEFSKAGIISHLAYYEDNDFETKENVFVTRTHISEICKLQQYAEIINKGIDYVLIQQVPKDIWCIRTLLDRLNSSAKIIYIQHDYLSRNLSDSVKNYVIFNCRYCTGINKLKAFIKLITWPLYWSNAFKNLKKNYKVAFNQSDAIVILSEKFLQGGQALIGRENMSKVVAIGNCLTLPYTYDCKRLREKKKTVLLVSRLCEDRKRITLALEIWRRVNVIKEMADWQFVIVGDGPNRAIYEKIVKIKSIPNIVFKGRQANLKPYYWDSSIFLMTSDNEGWGLTLTESLQSGVIPIAFHSFESISDIITNHKDGVIVDDGDIDGYVSALLDLMQDEGKRLLMAENAIAKSQNFAPSLVAEKWYNLFKII